MHEGFKELGYAVVERAVYDYRKLERAGVIINGQVIETWPTWNDKPLKISNAYDRKAKVAKLIHWFK